MGRALVAGLLAAVVVSPAATAADWRVVLEEDGIRVAQRADPERALPVFRARGEVAAPLEDVLSVIADIENQPAWLPRCAETRVLRRESPNEAVFYLRLAMPWPVSDRDAVVASETRRSHGSSLTRFRVTTEAGVDPVSGVVRMARLEGHWALQVVSEDRTRVEYQVDADPGGLVPGWLARRTATEDPLRTLQNLRSRVVATP